MEKDVSVYELLSSLCEKYIISSQNDKPSYNKSSQIRRSRSKCYEILLKKRKSQKKTGSELENINDPYCHLLAWQYQLLNKYNLPQYAEKLNVCLKDLENLNLFDDKILNNVLLLLLELRRVPTKEDKIMQVSVNRDALEGSLKCCTYLDDKKFHLPLAFSPGNLKFQDEHFRLPLNKTTIKETAFKNLFSFRDSPSTSKDCILNNEYEGFSSPSTSIWELASQKPPSNNRTWEQFGVANTGKEIPFVCESNYTSNEWLQCISTNYMLVSNDEVFRKVIKYQDFVKDIQLLLVGIESKTFKYDDRGELALVPGVCIEGVSVGAIKSYSKDHIFCGSCYKGLDNLCTPNPFTSKYINNGYIFKELCESIKKYLAYYRVVVFSIPHSTNLLALHERSKQVREYMKILASVCKVGPFSKSGDIPHGVHLLNYLYQKVMTLTNKNVLTVLYSVLYPCCQVYFSRFLRQWILEGTVHDPYGEFFIGVNPKYINSRGRTYWTRSYTLRQDIIPDFITSMHDDILFCGKAVKLLKLCIPNSPLYSYLSDKKSQIVCCCIMSEQLANVELNNHYYYLEATSYFGPRLSMAHVISRLHAQDEVFLSLVSKKRAATLCRIELEKKQKAEIANTKRQQEMKLLREEYAEAQLHKQMQIVAELEHEIQCMEKNIRIQSLHDKIIQEEAANLIEYYNNLFETSENRRVYFEKQIEKFKKVDLGYTQVEEVEVVQPPIVVTYKESADAERYFSSDSNLSYTDCCTTTRSDEFVSVCSSDTVVAENLDVQNANTKETIEPNANITNALENFRAAQRNRAKVLSLEYGFEGIPRVEQEVQTQNFANQQLTDAQRNKLKVMSSEFGVIEQFAPTKSNSLVEFNRNKMLASNKCFYHDEIKIDNRKDDINKNIKIVNNVDDNLNLKIENQKDNVINKWVNKKQDTLSLDFSKIPRPKTLLKSLKSPKIESEKISPMSIDSTLTASDTIMTPLEKVEKCDFENLPDTGTTVTATASLTSNFKNCFNFELEKSKNLLFNVDFDTDVLDKIASTKSISVKDSEAISSNCLKLCLQQSISIPLITQTKLVTNELLKYFIVNLKYLKHLECLKNYFFLMDGEFGRNITEGLFEQLYDANFPIDLVNCHTLQVLVSKALDYSSKCNEDFNCLSFRINNLPKVFDLGDPDVFDCVSLMYKATWPLNILLPSDTIAKYDDIFKFLLKLHRISWVLQNMFQNLKSLAKKTDSSKMTNLLKSPQYRRLHQIRHIMTNFIQTLQSYVVAEVLQTNWEIFEKNLESVINFDQLYTLHIAYIKNILFMCLLNQKSVPFRKVLHKIFIVILKFYDYLRSRSWKEVNNVHTHPNFKKLEHIFNNFEELVIYLFKIGYKVVKSGYQPHLMQLLNMLNINGYYSNKIVSESPVNNTN